ncbi:nucleotide exchange factor GrpE [Streptomyces palmae]|uniref:Protein GrpE n=1 Tax=Streptomyces palmae TaxID=1701085 RepID=A0A4Z0HHX2_9ACTN|nr:nucleotide exchange factor GrpE [Streptomyces palmae]TGB18273.1 nucleotide exchange factor GrpE [Streptomyces palmae]
MNRPTGTDRGGAPLTVVQDGRRHPPAALPGPPATRRRPAGRTAAPAPGPAASPQARLSDELSERTADLRRVKAEYDNYRKRVRRDRLAVREIAVANVLDRLLPVLDALTAAEAQGAVTGGFRQVAEALRSELAALGLRRFGAVGDPFDPALHQALGCDLDERVERAVCAEVVRPGYRVGAQLLRPAEVVVAKPP